MIYRLRIVQVQNPDRVDLLYFEQNQKPIR